MRITERKLRSIIRSVIKETYEAEDDKNYSPSLRDTESPNPQIREKAMTSAPKDIVMYYDGSLMFESEDDFVEKLKEETKNILDSNDLESGGLHKAYRVLFKGTVYRLEELEDLKIDFEKNDPNLENALKSLYSMPGNWVKYEILVEKYL